MLKAVYASFIEQMYTVNKRALQL